jgi:membrane protease YdiL (CAAX protease family)
VLGAAIFAVMLAYLEYRVFSFSTLKHPMAALTFVIALLVAINNAPIIALWDGACSITQPKYMLGLLALECIAVSAFEELAFRGVFFLYILQNRRKNKGQILLTTAVSSAVFGLAHFINMADGASFLSVALQIGYSFLIGGMCAVVLLRTRNVSLCILIHAIYNFGGNLIFRLGGGKLWDTPTVVITVVLGIAAAAFMFCSILTLDPKEVDKLYP